MKVRRLLTFAAAVPALFLFKEIFLSSPSSAEVSSFSSGAFEARFTGRTMRVDLFHTGGPKGETVAFDRAVDGQPDAPPRRDEPRQPFRRGAGPEDEPRRLLARLFILVQRMGADGRGEARLPDVS